MRITAAVVGVGSAICLAVAPLSGGATAAPSATLSALAPTNTLNLQFNEPAGSEVAQDISGMGHDGAIGSHVRMNGSFADWDRHPPGEGIYYGADHLVMVPDAADGSLDPGNSTFTVEIRYKSTDKFGNMIQKGQAKTAGGQIKFQQPKGVLSCMFKSPSGRATTSSKTPLNDGQWHVVTCVRTPQMVEMYVDGQFRSRIRNSTGTIDNKKPWTIGGKFDCDTSNPETGADSCDYFPGEIDYVKITKG